MNEDPNAPPIDPELEARIVALVLGEVSDFERDTLQQLIAERPELRAFQREMENVHGILAEIGAENVSDDKGDWKLSPDRRDALLNAIREPVTPPAVKIAATPEQSSRAEIVSLAGADHQDRCGVSGGGIHWAVGNADGAEGSPSDGDGRLDASG